VAQQWAWTFTHPGVDGKLGTEDDVETVDELHVKADKTYHFKLESTDVMHSFSVPAFRLKQDAIPGREITGWFKPTKTGSYDIQCAEICGIGHALMPARIHVETEADHAAWLASKAKST
jgi:cytochrome c oxidase subunit 2